MLSNIAYYLRRLWWSFFAKGAPIMLGIVFLNVLIYILELIWSLHFHSDWLIETFSLSPQGLAHQRYWQLFSYAWLHDQPEPFHLLMNMMAVGFFGRLIEWPLGTLRFILLYLGGSLSAALAWLYFDHPNAGDLVIGASGAAFALLTAAAVFEPKRILHVWIFFVLPLKLTIRRLAILLVLSEMIMFHFKLWPDVTHSAHLGGAAFGFIIMKFWKVRAGNSYPIDGPLSRL